jgi:hypothetical protein
MIVNSTIEEFKMGFAYFRKTRQSKALPFAR